ncbi:MAG TPA: sulfatase-like hydrolase/transferase [Acidimicrobiales bacterium]|nr:sulfatase-like hydrolase/transferase [Acidimicrobiales bacterium]
MPPNIVLVVMDTARADAFEPWGAARGATPSVAQMASTGQSFDHVRSTSNWTVPGHASMFSGELPRTLGLCVVDNVPQSCTPAIAAVKDRWLPEVLRQHGYATGAVSANLWISAHSGFDFGFDSFASVVAPRAVAMSDTGRRARLRWALQGARARTDDGALQAGAILDSWMDAGAQQPFFWFVNLTECHSPYLPPRPYNDMSMLARIKVADQARSNLTLESIWKTSLGVKEVPQAELESMRHLYQRSVLSMDDWVGRLLEGLSGHGLLDDTIVIVTSDHGENLGECGLLGHCFSLDDRLLHVPLVASQPGFGAGGLSSLLDVPRAIAEAVGLDDHPWGERDSGLGSVAQIEALTTADKIEDVITEWGLDDDAVQAFVSSSTCAVNGDLKLLRRGDGSEVLYRLDQDPLEASPIAVNGTVPDGTAGAVTGLRQLIDQAEATVSQVVHVAPHVEMDKEEEERIASKMKELGYL